MNKKEIIEILEMENELMTFDPHTGEDFDPLCLNELNKRCYEAHKEAIKLIKLMPDTKLMCQSKDNPLLTEVVYDSIFELPVRDAFDLIEKYRYGQLLPVDWVKSYLVKKKEKNKDDCIYWHYFEKDVLEMIEEWGKENEQKSR